MKRKKIFMMALVFILIGAIQVQILADNASLFNNNTAMTTTIFAISDTGKATVVVEYDGYPNITTGATIEIKIEKRSLLLFWSDVIEDTITVKGDYYYESRDYQLQDTGTYRCTVTYTVSGTGGTDDVLTFQDTEKYE